MKLFNLYLPALFLQQIINIFGEILTYNRFWMISKDFFCFFFPDGCQVLIPAGAPPIMGIPQGIFFVIGLVIIFGLIKFRHRDDFGCDGFVKPTGCFKFSFGLLGQTFLIFIMIKYRRSILGASVDTLSTGIGGVHMSPENIEQLAVRNFLRIVNHLHRFGMAGAAGGYLFIGRVFPLTAGITGYGLDNPLDFLKIRLYTPETPSGKSPSLAMPT